MRVKGLLIAACVGVLVLVPGVGAKATASIVLSFPDIAFYVGEERGFWLDLLTSQAHEDVEVEARFDAAGIASLADISTTTTGACTTEAHVMSCHHTAMDLPGSSIAFIILSSRGHPGTGQITITATVDGQALEPITTTLTVHPHGKLVAVGAKVSAPRSTTVRIKVGVKNLGPGPILWATPADVPHLVMAYINFPDHIVGTSTNRLCSPWGPDKYPELWGWLDSFAGSYRWACYGAVLEPGQTHWYELDIRMSRERPVVTGYITFRDGDTSPDQSAPIVIDTRGETLPVTGVPVRDATIAAMVLILSGVLLIARTRRTRRR